MGREPKRKGTEDPESGTEAQREGDRDPARRQRLGVVEGARRVWWWWWWGNGQRISKGKRHRKIDPEKGVEKARKEPMQKWIRSLSNV